MIVSKNARIMDRIATESTIAKRMHSVRCYPRAVAPGPMIERLAIIVTQVRDDFLLTLG